MQKRPKHFKLAGQELNEILAMINEASTPCAPTALQPWQLALRDCITDPYQLLAQLQLSPSELGFSTQAMQQFALRVPKRFVALMQPGDANDPLLTQILPIHAEQQQLSGYSFDPLQERHANPVPGLLHKYHGRVLLTIASGCGINCRFCFRRHFPYAANNPGRDGWQQALDYIANDASIREVIFSGGDPLLLPDPILAELHAKLCAIPHLQRVRIHSRMPIVLPERITNSFLAWFTRTRLQAILVTHCNHPRELSQDVAKAMQRAQQQQITLLNQTVLLRGVNDNATTLQTLAEKLFQFGILPYYLHLLDKVQGTAHFDLPRDRAQQLYQQLAANLSGYLVPKLVVEEAYARQKTQITCKST